VPIIKGDIENYMIYNGFAIQVEKQQKDFSIRNIEFNLKKRNIDHTFSLSVLKYFFLSASILATVLYYRIVIHSHINMLID
jgi:hypothetical protein